MPNTSLTRARIADLPTAVDFVRAYFAHEGLEFGPHVQAAIAQLLGDANLGRFWFIEGEGDRIGYLVLTFGFDHEFGGRIGLITDFYLVERARNQGHGQSALTLAIAEARSIGLRSIELYVLDHNPRAESFYRRVGFERIQGRAPMSMAL